MKRMLSFILAMFLILGMITTLTSTATAADGGEGSLYIINPDNDDVVNGNENVKIKWRKVPEADHYWLSIKTSSGDKPINQKVKGTSFTVKADTVFVQDGEIYKIYVAARNEAGEVLEGASAWEAIYVQASYSAGPQLTYATPAITAPGYIKPLYLPDRWCYYGVLDDEVDPTSDLKVRWENIHAPQYSISIAILAAGKADYGSTAEPKIATIVSQRRQTSRSYTIDCEDLKPYPGHWLKVVVQPVDPKTGNYGQMMMAYMRIATPDPKPELEPTPNPEPTPEPDPKPNGDHIVIGGVDTGFSVGQFFSKDGKGCTCHKQRICLEQKHPCNCIRYITHKGETIDLSAVQCFGWSRYIQTLLWDEHEASNSQSFNKTFINRRDVTAEQLKNQLLDAAPGTHIRTSDKEKGYAHSITVVEATSSLVKITDCNHSGRCQISVREYTYEDFAEFINAYGGIAYITVYNKAGNDSQASGETSTTIGDIDNDGNFATAQDLLLLAQHIAGVDVNINVVAADINQDGKVSLADLLRLIMLIT